MPRWTEELGAFALDREGNVTLASPIAEEISGQDLEHLRKQHYLEYIGVDDRDAARAIFEKALGGSSVKGSQRIVTSDGSAVMVGYTAQPDRQVDGEIVGVTGTVWLEPSAAS